MTKKTTQQKGNITEQKCFLKCLEYGYNISKPIFDNARYDFILDTGEHLLRIQVKTSTWLDEEHTAFSFNGYSQHSIGHGNKRMKYTKEEIDYFMTEKDNLFYLYPASLGGFTQKILRLKAKNPNNPQIIWAKRYEFEEVIKNF